MRLNQLFCLVYCSLAKEEEVTALRTHAEDLDKENSELSSLLAKRESEYDTIAQEKVIIPGLGAGRTFLQPLVFPCNHFCILDVTQS